MGLLQTLEDEVFSVVGRILSPFKKLFDVVGKLFSSLRDAFESGKLLADEIGSEIKAWRNFREAVPVRTGVISLPRAIDSTQELLNKFRDAWAAIVDAIKQVRDLLKRAGEAPPEEEAAQAINDIESGGFKKILERFPRLAKGLAKILEFVTIVTFIGDQVSRTFHDLLLIVDAVRGIREEIETGSTVFLQQKNKRRVETLKDGAKIKIRLGKLHQ